MNIVLLSRLCITLRHTDVTIGGPDQFALIAGAADVHVGGTELIQQLHSPDFRPLVNGTSDISEKGQPTTISFLKLLITTTYNRK